MFSLLPYKQVSHLDTYVILREFHEHKTMKNNCIHKWLAPMKTRSFILKTSSLSDNSVKLLSSLLTEQGLPVISLSTGKAYTFKVDLGAW